VKSIREKAWAVKRIENELTAIQKLPIDSSSLEQIAGGVIAS
jgi:hypothetical protein